MAIPENIDKVALTIAGSDSGGGAGIQADLKTFDAHDVFGTSAITALTAQNTVGVQEMMGVPPHMVEAQLQSILSDFKVGAAKTGMLYDAEVMQTVGKNLKDTQFPLVVDPVMVSTSGHALVAPDAVETMRKLILPRANLITPNLHEAQLLSGIPIRSRQDMETAARELAKQFPQSWLLIKGGHLGDGKANDLLFHRDNLQWIEGEYIPTTDTHGTGCTLSAAITAHLARGYGMPEAVLHSKKYLTNALRHAWKGLGKGHGSLRHHTPTR